jgi:hypothetical protein
LSGSWGLLKALLKRFSEANSGYPEV